jgi:FMN phosphatase YigB (HAD superfamily)
MIRTVVFDIGETITRDDRYWGSWADWLGVPRHTLSALVGAVVPQGRDVFDALRLARPGIDIEAESAAREAAGFGEHLDESDLHDDVRPGLGALRAAGLGVHLAGNQSGRAGPLLRGLDLPVDSVSTSAEWGVAKPSPGFFARVLEVAGTPAPETLYVGDHPANDVTPAKAAGLRAAHLTRGPWGRLWAGSEEAAAADWHISSILQLPELLGL